MKEINGIVVLNKPTGMNSMKAVKQVQYKLGAKKAGHLGTLDPMGTGILLIALGKATKLFEKHLNVKKTYRACFKFGVETDTLDSDGTITKKIDCDINMQQLKKVCSSFVGKYEQTPPIYSAKKVNGKKAYDLARAGQQVTLKTKLIEIFSLEIIKQIDKNTFLFEIECSSGTYIRSLCRDIANKLNTCATMVAIIRTKSGDYSLENSTTLQDLTEQDVIQTD